MDKQIFNLVSPLVRRNAAYAISNVPDGYRCEIRPRTRTLDQNSLIWSALTDISKQIDFVVNGALVKVSPEEVISRALYFFRLDFATKQVGHKMWFHKPQAYGPMVVATI